MEQEREGLMGEIANLETSLKHLKKNLASVRKEVEIESAKVEKYKHIEYLATSINRNTEAVKINNGRSYKQLINQQEDTLSNLKQFRVNLRKDNEELESQLMQSGTKKRSRVQTQDKC